MAVAANVSAGTMTSSPQPMPSALSATSRVTVPFIITIPWRAPWSAANRLAKAAAAGAGVGWPPQTPDRTTALTAATSVSSTSGQAG